MKCLKWKIYWFFSKVWFSEVLVGCPYKIKYIKKYFQVIKIEGINIYENLLIRLELLDGKPFVIHVNLLCLFYYAVVVTIRRQAIYKDEQLPKKGRSLNSLDTSSYELLVLT